jgi:hypothetical protein
MSFGVIGQHAEENMRGDPIGQLVIHRADGLDAAKGASTRASAL